jgi:hypothetical protein
MIIKAKVKITKREAPPIVITTFPKWTLTKPKILKIKRKYFELNLVK